MNRFAIKYSVVVIWNVMRRKLKIIDGSSFEVRHYSQMALRGHVFLAVVYFFYCVRAITSTVVYISYAYLGVRQE